MSVEHEQKIVDILVSKFDKLRDSEGNPLEHETAVTTPIDQLDIDSMALLQLLYEVEEAFGIQLDDLNPADFETLRDVSIVLTDFLAKTGDTAKPATTP